MVNFKITFQDNELLYGDDAKMRLLPRNIGSSEISILYLDNLHACFKRLDINNVISK